MNYILFKYRLKYRVNPLTFDEFIRFKNVEFDCKVDFYNSKKKAVLFKLFEEFLVYGGFPEIALMEKELKPLSLQVEKKVTREKGDRRIMLA